MALDWILRTRLDLLEQAVDEVDKIRQAMGEQRQRLDEVENCLKPQGELSGSEKWAKAHLGDAVNRLRLLLEDTSLSLTDADRDMLEAARRSLTDAEPILQKLTADRVSAHTSFEDIRRWSVAGLVDEELDEAAGDYRRLIGEIRNSAHPWVRYEKELRGRGQELFIRYLELLGGMAVRGWELEAGVADDVQALLRLLLQPLGPAAARSAPQPRSPQVLMGTRHIPLGYPDWRRWALPLYGRTAGQYLIEKGTFGTAVPERLQVLCADVFALYVLGPSYPYATLFLELDPDDPPPGALADSIRADLLLEKLPELDPGPQRRPLVDIATDLRTPWEEARAAVAGGQWSLETTDRKVVDEFFEELRESFKEIAYETRWLSEAVDLGRKLAAGGPSPLGGGPANPRDLITAIWLARQTDPTHARLIHERAKIVARRVPTGSRPTDPTRMSRPRGGV